MTVVADAKCRSAEFRLHPLGFFYLLDDCGGGVTRRVHVWLAGDSGQCENDRHQHSFDINSQILRGCLRNELFQFRESPDALESEFRVAYEGGRSVLSPTGRNGVLELLASFECGAGASYFLKAGIIHRVSVVERPCVTLLTTMERQAPIFSYGAQKDEQPFLRRPVNATEACEIEDVLSALEARI